MRSMTLLCLVALPLALYGSADARPRLFGRGACANGSCAVNVAAVNHFADASKMVAANLSETPNSSPPPEPTLDNDAIGPMPTVEAAVVIDNTAIATAVHFGGPFARVAGLARRPVAAAKVVARAPVRAVKAVVRGPAKIVKFAKNRRAARHERRAARRS